jgi:hypothetical protein
MRELILSCGFWINHAVIGIIVRISDKSCENTDNHAAVSNFLYILVLKMHLTPRTIKLSRAESQAPIFFSEYMYLSASNRGIFYADPSPKKNAALTATFSPIPYLHLRENPEQAKEPPACPRLLHRVPPSATLFFIPNLVMY